MSETFLDIKAKFQSVEQFIEWANVQEFTEMRQGCQGMAYCDLKLGNRNCQHIMYDVNIRSKGIKINPLRPFATNEKFYCWESIFGKNMAKYLAKKYDAKIMEAPYTEETDDYILIFNTFDGCLKFMWDTAEMYQKMLDLWKVEGEPKGLKDLFFKSYPLETLYV